MKTVYIKRLDLFEHIPMILFNNINEIDESFIEDNLELFSEKCTCNDGTIDGDKCENCGGNGYIDHEIYQYYIVDVSEFDIERLKEYGVTVGYSNKLDLYILPIYDFGTSWEAFSYSKEVDDDYILSSKESLECKTPY